MGSPTYLRKHYPNLAEYMYPQAGEARLFKAPLLETLTKTPGWIPAAIFLPVVAYLTRRSAAQGRAVETILGWMMGMVLWTLAEYLIHRFVFHFVPKSPWGHKIMYLFHGVHHQFPRDRYRLVMPLSLSIPLAIFFWMLFRMVFGARLVDSLLAGFVVGYVMYDSMHYLIHHFRPPQGHFAFLKILWRWHHIHHYAEPDHAFNVSIPLWDYIFGTTPRAMQKKLAREGKHVVLKQPFPAELE